MPKVNIGDVIKAPLYGDEKSYVITQLKPTIGGSKIIEDDKGKRLAMGGTIDGDIQVIGHMALEQIVKYSADLYSTQEMQEQLMASLEEQATVGPVEYAN